MSPIAAQITTGYFHAEHFGISEGLSQGVTFDMYADKNGFLWVSSVGSLQVFDGQDFINYDHILSGSYYGVFSVHSTDALYMLYGDELIKLNPDAYLDPFVQRLSLPDLPDEMTYRFMYENDQDLFISPGDQKIYAVSKDRFTVRDSFMLPVAIIRRPNLNISKVLPDLPEDIIPIVGEDFVLYGLNSRTHAVDVLLRMDPFFSITCTGPDTYYTLDSAALHMYRGDVHLKFPLPVPMESFLTSNFLRKDAATLLVGLQKSIYEFDLHKLIWTRRYERPEGGHLFDIQLRRMEVDHLGNIYYSRFTDGFVKLYAGNAGFEYIGVGGNQTSFVHCMEVSHQDNLVLLGSLRSGLFVFDTLGTLLKRYFDQSENPHEAYIENIIRLSENRYLILLHEAAYLFSVRPNGEFQMTQISGLESLWSSYFSYVLPSFEDNKYFIVAEYGLLAISDTGQITFEFHQDHPAPGMGVCKYQDGYLSAAPGKLIRFDKNFNPVPDGTIDLPAIHVTKCMVPYDAEHVLMGTLDGLYLVRVDTQAEVVRKIYDKIVYAILPGDHKDEFWFSTDFGLYAIDSTFALKRFPKESGLQENEFNTAIATRSNTGKLYFGGVNGITAFYPKNVIEENRNHISYLKSLSINGALISRCIPQDSSFSMTLGFHENMLSLELLAFGTKPPSTFNYQYFMEGLNTRWVDLGHIANINFHLSPGNYRFYYHISEAFDPDAPKQTPVRIRILPPIYRQWWFITLLFAIAAAIGYALFRQNKKRLLLKAAYERKLLEDLHTERMRISRELHDNIGAQMATVKRSVNFLTSNSDKLSPDQVRSKMHDLESISTQINQQLRDTIWVTQHEQIPVSAFIARLKNYVYQMLGQESEWKVSYSEHLTSDSRLGPFTALNLHRICQEALNNAVKHSGGNTLHLDFADTPASFTVKITDNGRGFDPQQSTDNYGLGNMKHRAGMIHARLDIQSNPGSGTQISVVISHDPKPVYS